MPSANSPVSSRYCLATIAFPALPIVAEQQLIVAVVILMNYGLSFDVFPMSSPVNTSRENLPQAIDPYSVEYNVAAQIDKAWLPGRKYQGNWDAQGLLTTLPAFVITLLGATLIH